MKIRKTTKDVLISSFNFEGYCDVDWCLVIDENDLSFSVEIPLELVVKSYRYDDNTDEEIPFESKIKFSKVKVSKFEVYPNEALDIKKIEVSGEIAKVIL